MFLTFSTKQFQNRTKVCIESLEKFYPNEKVVCYNLDDSVEPGSYVKDLPKKRLEVVKEYLLKGANYVVVIGADCVLYNKIDNFLNMEGNVILIPHVIRPPKEHGEKFYQTGHVNADLMLFRKESLPVIDWLLKQDMRNDIEHGFFYEQTWLSALPFIFDDISICKDPAINYAYYNFDERQLDFYQDNYFVNLLPLKMVQFSGYVEGQPEIASRYYNKKITGTIFALFNEYEQKIRNNK